MATRTEIAADLRRTFGANALTKKQVGEYMGYKPRATYDFLRDVDAIESSLNGIALFWANMRRNLLYPSSG